MKLNTTHLMVGAAAALALLALRARARPTTPTTAANRAAQLRADAYRGQLWNELRTQPDFWV